MKKAVIFLLAAVLLAGASPVTQAQTTTPLSVDLAEELLQKITGNWMLNLTVWNPESEKSTKFNGTAKITQSNNRYVREQFEVPQPDGSTLKGEGTFRYSKSNNRIEFTQKNDLDQTEIVMVGKWYPEHNLLIFRPTNHAGKALQGQQWRYVFLQDGTFSKVVHRKDAQGKATLASIYHYNHASVAGL